MKNSVLITNKHIRLAAIAQTVKYFIVKTFKCTRLFFILLQGCIRDGSVTKDSRKQQRGVILVAKLKLCYTLLSSCSENEKKKSFQCFFN
jgi:hypothetical protein